jgi:succinyl-CoA synthetase alpha subunit
MAIAFRIVPKEYRDSVSLMQLSALLSKLPGVEQASAVMATENNVALLAEAGLGVSATGATATDLLVVVRGEASALPAVIDEALKNLTRQASAVNGRTETSLAPRSIQMARAESGPAQMALISTPGEYAAAEAMKALRLGLNVMLFSDNVSEQDELRLKQAARARGLMVMGPDCGTAIVNGIPLAFANVVKRGPIGAAAASGTGLQEVTVLVDRLGSGISQAIGTGGRDLQSSIGGISMLTALRDLAGDPATKVIVLISKPPAPEVTERILSEARKAAKPVVVVFIGADPARLTGGNVHGARTLEDAAYTAVALAQGELREARHAEDSTSPTGVPRFAARQRYIRGLFSGGTFCYEAVLLLDERLRDLYSNTPARPAGALSDLWHSHHHTLIDLGDDLFTRGRPHPMIDYRLRNERIVKEAADAETAVILLDVVLGYGSHADPAAELVPAIGRARAVASAQGRNLVFVAHVCGTQGDPQGFQRQADALTHAGVMLARSNAHAARLAASIVQARGVAE